MIPALVAVGAAAGAAQAGATYAGQSEAAAASREANYWNRLAYKESQVREDNAVQRRVADLRAAGLSPTLAAGSAAQTMSPVQIGPDQTVDPGAALAAGLQPILAASQLGKTAADTKLVESQAQNVQYDTLSKAWKDKLLEATFPTDFIKKLADIGKTYADTRVSSAEAGLRYRMLERDMASNLRPGSLASDLYDTSQVVADILKKAGNMMIGPMPKPGGGK